LVTRRKTWSKCNAENVEKNDTELAVNGNELEGYHARKKRSLLPDRFAQSKHKSLYM